MNLIAPLLAVTLAVVGIFDGLSFAKFLSRISGPRVVVGAVGNRIPPNDAGKARGETPNSAWSLPGLWFAYMSTETLLIIVVLVLLLGGGGFFWSRRGR